MMFAGGGLFLSMVATTIWISGDVTRMREEERAKQAEKCAIAAQSQTSQVQPATGTAPPANDFTTQPAPQPVDDSCATTTGGASDGTTDGQVDPNVGAVDPVTGAPLAQDASSFDSGGPNLDPATGQPVDPAFDPAASASVDPATGQPILSPDPAADPLASQGVTGEPTSSVVEAGF